MTDSPRETQKVVVQTSYGSMVFELRPDRTPNTVANFLQYVRDGFYDSTLFHRVVENFVIQGGGFEPGLIQKTTRTPIANESARGLRNARGTIAMARLPHDPDSATAQFFINTRDNDSLDHRGHDDAHSGYCAFGTLVEGVEILERIESVATTTVGEHQGVPIQEIVIKHIRLMP